MTQKLCRLDMEISEKYHSKLLNIQTRLMKERGGSVGRGKVLEYLIDREESSRR